MGENMPDCVGANNGPASNPWAAAPYSYDQIYNLAASIVKKQQDQQYNAYQNHVQKYALEQFAKQTNAPPGFSNAAIPPPPPTLMDIDVPPPPSFYGNSTPQNNKQFGGIRFNLNPKRLQNSPLMNNGIGMNNQQQLQQAQQQQIQHMQQQQQQQQQGNNGKKKKKKKNKQNQQQNHQQMQQHNQKTMQQHNQQPNGSIMGSPNFLDTSIPPPNLSLPQQRTPDLSKPPPFNPFSSPKPSLSPLSQPTTPSSSSPSLPNSSPVPPPPPSTPNAAAKKPNPYNNPTDAWPESLNRYVERCYAKCKTDFDKDQIQICLKGRITQAANRGELWTKDWDNEPTPSVHSERNNVVIPKQPNQGVPGQLASFQNKAAASAGAGTPKKGISQSLGLRLGNRGTKRTSRSRSRSPYTSSSRKRRNTSSSSDDSRSPQRKARRSSSSSSSEDYKSFSKSSSKKITSRLGTAANNNAQQNASKNKKNKNKKENNKKFGSLGGDIVSDAERLQQRAARFTEKKTSAPHAHVVSNKKKKHMSIQSRLYVDDNADNNFDLIDFHIVGTCRDIEKSFLRLTKAPEAHEVRPEEVLVFSLANARSKWTEKKDYYYACDQLKSIRQDLTVSRIEFLVGFLF